MELRRDVAERIHQVTDAYVNWFIVEDGPSVGVTVVDAGHPRSWTSLQHALHDLGRRPHEVEAIVLTHGHFDHVGFVQRAHEELAAPVWVHERDAPLVAHPWRYEHERSRLPYFVRHPRFVWIFTAMGAAGALLVKGIEDVRTHGGEGELDVPGQPRIVFTPGHTHGHCALHFPDRGALIAGDAVVTMNPYTGRTGPQIVSGAATADSARALASLDVLAHADVATLLVGHGEPYRGDPAAAVAAAREAGPS